MPARWHWAIILSVALAVVKPLVSTHNARVLNCISPAHVFIIVPPRSRKIKKVVAVRFILGHGNPIKAGGLAAGGIVGVGEIAAGNKRLGRKGRPTIQSASSTCSRP